jgi:basic membrane protein A
VLTSVVWNWGVYYKHIIRAIIDGRFNTEPYFGGISEGFVDITPFNPAVAVDGRVRDAVESAKNRIKAGYNVFDGELRTNEGAVIGSVGGTLSDNEIKQGINWYYHNVEEIK